ncbi:MAG: DUF501 domain-containing protein [Actinomycetaceae bacterium]|nr:DUF501 domain-containing protein [Actinomycetaceae bacterium]
MSVDISDAEAIDRAIVERQLGRVPRGVLGIAARCVCGAPLVVSTAPRLPDGTPFPTLYYLSHPAAVKGCSTLEAQQWMDELNTLLAEDSTIAKHYWNAHQDYIDTRESIEKVPEIAHFSAGGMPQRVKCLHALLAHTLAAGPGVNPIGDLVLERLVKDGLWDHDTCRCVDGQRPGDFTGENLVSGRTDCD